MSPLHPGCGGFALESDFYAYSIRINGLSLIFAGRQTLKEVLMYSFLKSLNQTLWGFPMLFLLFGTHIFFTWKLKFVQKSVFQGIRLSFSPSSTEKSSSGMSGYSALMTMLAATLGTGNIVGISTAVAYGGPGAVLWCWLTGLLGMATSYAECYLCHYHRRTLADGTQTGGPMYVLLYSMKKKRTAIIYAVCILLASFLIGAGTQANAIAMAASSSFHINPVITGLACCLLTGLVLMCGVRAIGKFCSFVVPFMGLFYIFCCLIILYLNREQLLPATLLILKSAFAKDAMIGGLTGGGLLAAMRYGIARGLYTNEAGLGTAGITSACANTSASKEQALISMTGVFWDTVIMCGITGLLIVTNLLRFPESVANISAGQLTSAAFLILPAGKTILSISLILFAISTIIGWSFFGEQAVLFFFHKTPGTQKKPRKKGMSFQTALPYYKSIYLIMIFAGALISMDMVWELTDFINLFLFLINIFILFRQGSIIRGT